MVGEVRWRVLWEELLRQLQVLRVAALMPLWLVPGIVAEALPLLYLWGLGLPQLREARGHRGSMSLCRAARGPTLWAGLAAAGRLADALCLEAAARVWLAACLCNDLLQLP